MQLQSLRVWRELQCVVLIHTSYPGVERGIVGVPCVVNEYLMLIGLYISSPLDRRDIGFIRRSNNKLIYTIYNLHTHQHHMTRHHITYTSFTLMVSLLPFLASWLGTITADLTTRLRDFLSLGLEGWVDSLPSSDPLLFRLDLSAAR
jgi:hypothetical protein